MLFPPSGQPSDPHHFFPHHPLPPPPPPPPRPGGGLGGEDPRALPAKAVVVEAFTGDIRGLPALALEGPIFRPPFAVGLRPGSPAVAGTKPRAMFSLPRPREEEADEVDEATMLVVPGTFFQRKRQALRALKKR